MRSLRKFVLVVVWFLLSSPQSYADGNKLLEQCIAVERFLDTKAVGDELNIGICLGLVQGVRNTMLYMGNEGQIKACFPEKGIDNGQATKVVVKYLKNNPALLHEDEVLLIILAFLEAYPCS